jgi:hypothetical protein
MEGMGTRVAQVEMEALLDRTYLEAEVEAHQEMEEELVELRQVEAVI